MGWWPPWGPWATQDQVRQLEAQVKSETVRAQGAEAQLQLTVQREIQEMKMAVQADIDALTAAVSGVSTDLTAAVTNINAEIAALKVANPALDVTALQAAVAGLQTVQATVDAIETPPPAPAA